jgi:hypothetical protein
MKDTTISHVRKLHLIRLILRTVSGNENVLKEIVENGKRRTRVGTMMETLKL